MLSAVSRLAVTPVTLASSASPAASSGGSGTGELTEEQQKQVAELKARDAEVRAHERAHAGAGGAYAGSPSYTMAKGPDNKSYAIGGEVQIDTSPEGDAAATIAKMNVVIAAALAPAEPSAADRAVAASARQTMAVARGEYAQQKQAESLGESDETTGVASEGTEQVSASTSAAQPGEPVNAALAAQAANAYTATYNLFPAKIQSSSGGLFA